MKYTREFFQKHGSRGGKIGAKIAWANMTEEQKKAKIKKMIAARKKVTTE